MDPFDASVADLNEVNMDSEALRGIERDLAVGLESKIEGRPPETASQISINTLEGAATSTSSVLNTEDWAMLTASPSKTS